MLHQWDQRADADTRKIGCCTRRNYHRGKIGRSDADRALSTVGQLDHHVGGATSGTLPNYRKPFTKQAVLRIRNRDMSYGPIKNCRILRCSVTRQSPMPSLIASSTPRTASPSTARPCANHRKKPPNAESLTPTPPSEPLKLSTGPTVRDHRNAVRDRSESLSAIDRNHCPHSPESAAKRVFRSVMAVRDAPVPTQNRVVSTTLAPGVVLIGGGSHNSV